MWMLYIWMYFIIEFCLFCECYIYGCTAVSSLSILWGCTVGIELFYTVTQVVRKWSSVFVTLFLLPKKTQSKYGRQNNSATSQSTLLRARPIFVVSVSTQETAILLRLALQVYFSFWITCTHILVGWIIWVCMSLLLSNMLHLFMWTFQ